MDVPPWVNRDGNSLSRINPYASSDAVFDIPGYSEPSGLIGGLMSSLRLGASSRPIVTPANDLSRGQQNATLPNTSRQDHPQGDSVEHTLRVANFTNSAITFRQDRVCFLPSKVLRVGIRKDDEGSYRWLDFLNVTARDVLDTCSLSKTLIMKRETKKGRLEDVKLDWDLERLAREAGDEENLKLVVMDK